MGTSRRLDLAIRNGLVIDGTGAPRGQADVGILGEQIVEVGSVGPASRDVDATGQIVAPGFIDPHSHSDWTLHANRDAASTIRQGVTTEVVGNCGITNAPVSEGSLSAAASRLSAYGYDGPITWRSFAEYLADVEDGGTAQNLAFLVGHSTIREAAGVSGTETSGPDLEAMGGLLQEAMQAGALGMSSGLEYGLGATADTGELQYLVNIVGRHGGIYASHVRNRDEEVLDSIEEFLSIVRMANAAGQISHLNVRHDTNAPVAGWAQAVQMMMETRAQGYDVQADTTPFRQGIGIMTGLLPSWLLAEGPTAAAKRLADPDVRSQLRNECDRYWRFVHKGQWDRVRLLSSPQLPEFNGSNFVDIARKRNQDPWDSYFDILSLAGESMGNLIMVGDLFTAEHLDEMIAHPLFSLGVDAYTSTDSGPLKDMTPSPLPYSGHIRYLAHHVRERRTITLEEAIRKMSGMPARRFDLRGRGLIRSGYFADIVVFDFDNLKSDSSFENPAVYPEGVSMVLVNGDVAVESKNHTGKRAGRVLRRPS